MGGVDEETNQTFGIFVKRVFAGGLASINGKRNLPVIVTFMLRYQVEQYCERTNIQIMV